MNINTVNAIAEHLAAIDADWRKASGYTGRPVHRKAYWRNAAARLLADPQITLRKQPTQNQTMIYIGIDNGISGGIAVLSDMAGVAPIALSMIPSLRHRSRNEIDIAALDAWLASIGNGWHIGATYIIEEPNNSRNAGTAYSVAASFHSIRGYLIAKQRRWHRITPQAWQRVMLPGCAAGDTKPAALAKARQLWPTETWKATPRCTTPHVGIVDAALIAEYGRIANL